MMRLILLFSLLSSPAFASGGGLSWLDLLWHALNLGILLGLLIYFGKKPLLGALKERAEGIQGEIGEAAQLHDEALALLAKYQSKLSGLEAEAERLLTEYRLEAEAEKQHILEEAEREAERIQREARRSIEGEMGRVRAQLQAEVVDMAIAAAEEAIRLRLNSSEQQRLTREYLKQLDTAQVQ